MKTVCKTCLLIVCFVLLLSGCFTFKQPGRRIDYYSLEYDPPVDAAGRRQIPAAIHIQSFQVAPFYNSTRIIFRDKPFSRNEYYYHKWRANPGDTVTSFLRRDFQASSLFKAVFSFSPKHPSDYILEGIVEEFFEQDNANAWEAVLSVSITLIKSNESDVSRRILFQKRYHGRTACDQKNPQSLSKSMSIALKSVSKMIINDVYLELALLNNSSFAPD